MSAPQDYGQGQAPFQQPYDGQAAYQNQVGSPPPQGGQPADAPGKKKKRAYAAGAFDVASGGNAAVGGQLPGGGQFGAPQPAAGYGGYPGQEQPATGYPAQQFSPAGTPAYQQPAYGAPPGPDMSGLTQGMANMQMGAGQPMVQQPQQQQVPQARAGPLNQLYPTDLLNQPFNVSELDLPPPPIILPPNVSPRQALLPLCAFADNDSSQAARLPRMPTARRNMCALHSMPFPQRTLSSRSRSSHSPLSSSHMPHSTIWMTKYLSSRIRSFRDVAVAGPT